MIKVFYRKEMVAETKSFSPSPSKPERVVSSWLSKFQIIEVVEPEPVTVDQLCLAHDRKYVKGVLSCELKNGFSNRDEAVAKSLPYTSGAMPCAAREALKNGKVSIGLGFDLHVDDVISPTCVAEYEEFWMKVSDEPELFDAIFGALGGYAEPRDGFPGQVHAQVALQSIPNILQPWLFYGRRMGMDEVLKLGTLENFVEECTRIFDKICEAGFYA